MFTNPKTCIGFEDIEQLPETPSLHTWKSIILSRKLGLYILGQSSLNQNFTFTDYSSTSTVIINYSSTYYFNEVLEFHLTAIKLFDYYSETEVISNIHLTIRSLSKYPKNLSVYYELQHINLQFFRFVKTFYYENKQLDDMSEFLGQQGFFYVSSAVLQPVLKILSDMRSQLYIENDILKLR